jgi:hypothetical protein
MTYNSFDFTAVDFAAVLGAFPAGTKGWASSSATGEEEAPLPVEVIVPVLREGYLDFDRMEASVAPRSTVAAKSPLFLGLLFFGSFVRRSGAVALPV